MKLNQNQKSKTILAQGAEAVIYLRDNTVTKIRLPKGYRHPTLDLKMRKHQLRREVKVLEQLAPEGFSPKVIGIDEDACALEMSYIDGEPCALMLSAQNYQQIMSEIGKIVAKVHNKHIIHGDLTTSNMVVSKSKPYLIDFGLSYQSDRVEDKAVDLHVLRESMEARHHLFWKKAFAAFIEGYSEVAEHAKDIIHRLKAVELRGRYKQKT